MINFIIEEEKLKEVIDNYMMNYNYTYDIKIYDSYKENNYFNIYILNYDYPVFNFADICIVISIISLIYLTLKGGVYDNSK